MRLSCLAVILAASTAPAVSQTNLDDSYPADALISFNAMHQLVSADLLDPSSAQYKGMFRQASPNGTEFICGWVNFKNPQGGYDEFRPFYAAPSLGKADIAPAIGASLIYMAFETVGCADKLGLPKRR